MSRCIFQVSQPESIITPKWSHQSSGKKSEPLILMILLCTLRRLTQNKVTKILLKVLCRITCTLWLIATTSSLRAKGFSLSSFVTHGDTKSGQVIGVTIQTSGHRAYENSSKLRLMTRESSLWALRTTSQNIIAQVSALISLRGYLRSLSRFPESNNPSSTSKCQRN